MTSVLPNEVVNLRQRLKRYRSQLQRLEHEHSELAGRLQHVESLLVSKKPQGRRDLNAASAELVRTVQSGNPRPVRKLLDAGADPNARSEDAEPVLHLATQVVAVVRELLRAGARVDERDELGNTALMTCARDEDLAMVRELVKHGADVNAVNRDGDTPLTNAASWGSEKVVKHLLSHGANPALTDGLGVAAAELARQQGHRAIARMLDHAAEQ